MTDELQLRDERDGKRRHEDDTVREPDEPEVVPVEEPPEPERPETD